MKYILDTDICIYWLNGNIKVEKKILDVGLENVGTTIITIAELYYGAYKSKKVDRNLESLRKLEGLNNGGRRFTFRLFPTILSLLYSCKN